MILRYTEADSDRAHDEWRANCGPHTLAAALALTLDQARALLTDFEARGLMNPTMMETALARAAWSYVATKGLYTSTLCEGINRIQWEGSWLNKGVPIGAAYARTHWVAAAAGFVLCTACAPAMWLPEERWRHLIAQRCREEIKGCTGWHVTHHYAFPCPAKEVRA